MHLFIPLLATSALALAAPGQTLQFDYVSPEAAGFTKGNVPSGSVWGSILSRVQQIDPTLTGTRLGTIRALAWRRYGGARPSVTYLAELEILMAHAIDPTRASTTFVSNYKTSPTRVFNKKAFRVDFTQTPNSVTDFDVVIPFDTPFAYNRTDPLLWETRNTSGRKADATYNLDAFRGLAPGNMVGPTPTALGSGCTTPNGVMRHITNLTSNATQLSLTLILANAPSNQSTLMLLGAAPTNIPLFCGTLRVQPAPGAVFSLGTTSARGIALVNTTRAWSSAFADSRIVTQVLALDPSQASGVALSNGVHTRGMRRPGGARPFAVIYSFVRDSVGPTSGPHIQGGIATKLIQ